MRHLRAIPACLFAWLLPGGGHLFLGRVRSGLALSGSIGALFGLGMNADTPFYVSIVVIEAPTATPTPSPTP